MDAHEERNTRERRFKIVALASLSCALIAGVLAFTVPAVAQTDGDDSGGDDDTDEPSGEQGAGEAALAERLSAALEPLVTAGTITAEQRDAVVEALLSARRSLIPGDGHRWHHAWRSGVPLAAVQGGDDLLDLLGVTRSDLLGKLRVGQTLADIAANAGVDIAAVVDLLVEPLVSRVEAAVEAGRLGEENREACVSAVEGYVTARVNGEEPGDDADLRTCSSGASRWQRGRSWMGHPGWSDDGQPPTHRGRGSRGRFPAAGKSWSSPPAAA